VPLSSIRAGLLGLACSLAFGQEPARDPRVDELKAEIAQLNRSIADQERRLADFEKSPIGQFRLTIADQGRRIAELEKTVKVLQQSAAPVLRSDWHVAVNWALIRKGMSEVQVVNLLGSPTRVQSVVDVRTLFYQPDPKSGSTPHGSVTLKDDRVTASDAPDF
jgi:hypothetical protein